MATIKTDSYRISRSWPKKLLFLGLLIASYGLLAQIFVSHHYTVNSGYKNQNSNSSNLAPVQKPSHLGLPSRLQIPDLMIDVAVVPGAYNPDTEDWSIGSSTASYAQTTPPVNDRAGTTLLYGHNNRKVFMPLFSILPSALATVTSDDGQKFIYRFESQNDILPTDTQSLKNTYAPNLVLLTCSGPNYSRRTLFHFYFVRRDPT